jgi:hypothetical protein
MRHIIGANGDRFALRDTRPKENRVRRGESTERWEKPWSAVSAYRRATDNRRKHARANPANQTGAGNVSAVRGTLNRMCSGNNSAGAHSSTVDSCDSCEPPPSDSAASRATATSQRERSLLRMDQP